MASYTIAAQFTTISITTTGDDVTPRGNWLRVKNLGANQVSYSEVATPSSGAAAAGSQSTLVPAAAGGKTDEFLIQPNQKMFFKANTGATLLAFEELYNLPQKT
jgi:hypothetical protein